MRILSIPLLLMALQPVLAQVPCGNEAFEPSWPHALSSDAIARGSGDDTLEIMTVPVVFHIIHEGEAIGSGTNLTDAEIISSLACVNDGFRHAWGTGVDTRIEFCLATVDPDGQPTTGITRTNGIVLFPAYANGVHALFTAPCAGTVEGDSIVAHTTWSQTEYLNIWVFNFICGASGVGYSPIMAFRGVFMRYDYMECPPVSTLVHEIGHACGLSHTFLMQSGPCPVEVNCSFQGDGCCDTPPHVSVTCDNDKNPCDPDMPLQLWYNTRYNLMSYCGGSYDQKRFTNDQRTRMRVMLRDEAPELLTSTNCAIATGIHTSDADGLSIHPNPVREVLYATSSGAPITAYELRDAMGRRVRASGVNARQFTLQRGDLAPGAYFITIRFEKGSTTRKLTME